MCTYLVGMLGMYDSRLGIVILKSCATGGFDVYIKVEALFPFNFPERELARQ